MSDRGSTTLTTAILTTTVIAFLSGYIFGVYTIRGYLLSPALVEERRRNFQDPVESDESDVEEDDTVLDHAPNWSNGLEADRRQGLRQESVKTEKAVPASAAVTALSSWKDSQEECKLVLVVRTDLGMTKGKLRSSSASVGRASFRLICEHDRRQDRSTVWPRNTRMLQSPFECGTKGSSFGSGPRTEAVGKIRASKDCRAGQE
jgi:peptidyl-tRNA hydrolase, PTH2 family